MNLFGQVTVKHESAASTNLLALNLIEKGECVNGMAVITGNQTAGKGYGTNRWDSEPDKNLTVSFIYQPDRINASSQFYLNKAVSLAVTDLLLSIGLPGTEKVSVKWPNDAYINNCKAGGILISHIISGELIDYSVIGIGLNINQEVFAKDIPNPVSLKVITGKEYDIEIIYRQLCGKLDYRTDQFQRGEFERIQADYLQNLYRMGTPCLFAAENKTFEAIIRGVDPFGRLLVEMDGKMKEFAFKELEYLL